MTINVALEWFDEPRVIVELQDEIVHVRAHPGLSESQVREACANLDGRGPAVLAAWQRAVGLDDAGSITLAR
jgi:hypothetical protein